MTIIQLCDLFIYAKKMEGLKPSTLSSYSYSLNRLLFPFLMKQKEQVTKEHFYKVLEFLYTNLSRNTVITNIIILNDFLKFIQENHGYEPKFTFPIPSIEKNNVNTFNNEEREQLIGYLVSYIDYFKFGILLALYTGMRIGELCALQKKDINKNCITVSKTLQRIKNLDPNSKYKTKIVIDKPKSNTSYREVPLIEDLRLLFNNLYGNMKDDCYILTGTPHYIEPRTVERRFKVLLEKASIEYRNFHVLRHTFATNCANRKMEIKTLSEILGHSTSQITLDKYVHPDFSQKVSEMEKIYMTKMS